MEEAEKVKVVVRCRPISETEKSQGHKVAVTCSDEEKAVTVKMASDPSRTFYFDAVFPPNTDQMTVYNIAARPIVENVLKGYNGGFLKVFCEFTKFSKKEYLILFEKKYINIKTEKIMI